MLTKRCSAIGGRRMYRPAYRKNCDFDWKRARRALRCTPSKERGEPMELHGLVNRPSCSDRKQPSDWNREVCCALERVVLCVENGMQPSAARQFSEWKTEVVSKHSEPIKQIGPARQEGAPASSHCQPCNVHNAIQHEQIRAQPMQAQG